MNHPSAQSRRRASILRPLTPEALAQSLQIAADHRVAQRYDEAIPIYLDIERRNPDVADAAYFLVLIDLARDRPADALPRLRALVRRFPKIPNLWNALAYTQDQLGQSYEAIAAYRRLAVLSPTSSRAELAGLLEAVGRIEEANDLFHQIAARPETRLAGLTSRATRRPGEITPAERKELTGAAVADQTPVEARININFALGKVLEAQGDYDAAFARFDSGNRLKRATLTREVALPERALIGPRVRSLDPAQLARDHQASISFMKSVFTSDFITSNQGRGHNIAAPIFVVGMPRSGSTLIEQILSSHRRIQGLGESDTLGHVLSDRFPYDLFAANPSEHFRSLAEAYFKAQHARGWGSAPRFVDKLLHNYMYVGMIHLMLPKAVILHAVRDPVDTCLGAWRQNFRSGNEETYDLADIGHAYVRYRQVMNHWDTVLKGRVIEVNHEAMVNDPESRIRWLITEACGLDWDPACLRFHETRGAVRTASVAQVRQPIFTTSLQRWRRYESHLGLLFDALGPYAPTKE
jgi:tetratricopeptide (TPR) repeat protein